MPRFNHTAGSKTDQQEGSMSRLIELVNKTNFIINFMNFQNNLEIYHNQLLESRILKIKEANESISNLLYTAKAAQDEEKKWERWSKSTGDKKSYNIHKRISYRIEEHKSWRLTEQEGANMNQNISC